MLEYKHIRGSDYTKLLEVVNSFAAAGWQLFQVVALPQPDTGADIAMILVRDVKVRDGVK